jgi:hypothetical protein
MRGLNPGISVPHSRKARLEALADPGGIMVSSVVHDQVRDKLSFGFEDMGEQIVKNISRPIGRPPRLPRRKRPVGQGQIHRGCRADECQSAVDRGAAVRGVCPREGVHILKICRNVA